MRLRTKNYALRIIKLCEFLETWPLTKLIGRQLFRAGTSVAANYRAACKARSAKDFISKLGIVIEECDESIFWLELLKDSGFVVAERIESLLSEGKEITAIMIASKNSAIKNQMLKSE